MTYIANYPGATRVVPALASPVPYPKPSRRGVVHDAPPAVPGGLGFIDVIAGVVGSIFGAKSQERAARHAANAQERAAMAQAQAITEAARLDSAARTEIAKLGYEAADLASQRQLEAVNLQYKAALDAQRRQAQSVVEQGVVQLVGQTQQGIFTLAQSELVEAGESTRAFPAAATKGAIAIVGVTVVALAFQGRGRRKKGGPASQAVAAVAA